MIYVKRAYEPAEKNDGARFLVDHLWPRGVKKEDLEVKAWLKSVSPSNELRTWFGHDPAKWDEFQRRYSAELEAHPKAWSPLVAAALEGDITLVFGARDTEHNNAVALRIFLIRQLKNRASAKRRSLAVA